MAPTPLFKIGTYTDYVEITCEKCNADVDMNYCGRDPSMPLFDFSCQNESCENHGTIRLKGKSEWKGYPAEAAKGEL